MYTYTVKFIQVVLILFCKFLDIVRVLEHIKLVDHVKLSLPECRKLICDLLAPLCSLHAFL